jgi:hypothetical protein
MQTRLQSAIEVSANYLIGFLLAWFIQCHVLRLMGFPVSGKQAGGITLIFTAVSIIRSYALRRFFNWFNARVRK